MTSFNSPLIYLIFLTLPCQVPSLQGIPLFPTQFIPSHTAVFVAHAQKVLTQHFHLLSHQGYIMWSDNLPLAPPLRLVIAFFELSGLLNYLMLPSLSYVNSHILCCTYLFNICPILFPSYFRILTLELLECLEFRDLPPPYIINSLYILIHT